MTEPIKYVVTANFLGTLTRGDVVTAKELPSDPKALLADGSIRQATAEEQKGNATWVDEPHKVASSPQPKKGARARGTGGRFVGKGGDTAPATRAKSASKKTANKDVAPADTGQGATTPDASAAPATGASASESTEVAK